MLFAAYKGDIDYFRASAEKLDGLPNDARILIAEACTHNALDADIGRVKIPAMLRKKLGNGVRIDVVGGCSHFFFQGENVGMYADHRCRLVSFSGRVRFDLEFVNEVYAFLPGKSFGSCMLATMGELQGIRLR